MNGSGKTPSLTQALIPISFLIILLTFNVIYFGENTLNGANQIALMLAAAVAGMMNTICLIMSAMIFGGAMESAGMLVRITQSVLNLPKIPVALLLLQLQQVFFLISLPRISIFQLWYPEGCLQIHTEAGDTNQSY